MQNRIKAAMGVISCDISLKNVTYLNVFTNEWLKADIGINDGIIVGLGEYKGDIEYDYSGKYAVPSFIDSHVHIESSLATPAIFTEEILPFGTTTIVADPHEIANVSGISGLAYMFRATQKLPINAYIMLPSCVPASDFETSGAILTAKELLPFTTEPNCLGLGEMMNNSFIYDYNKDIIKKLQAFQGKNIDGHAPCLDNRELNAYKATGVRNDHETSFPDDVINKVRLGFKILARQGSSCKNLTTILKTALDNNLPFYNFAYCSDDKHIADIREHGHISYCIKLALSVGVPLEEAYKMASFYPANNFGLNELGAIAPSYQADIAILDDLNNVNVIDVYSNGVKVVENKNVIANIPSVPCPKAIRNSVNIDSFDISDLELKITKAKSPIINVMQGELLTKLTWTEIDEDYFDYQNGLKKVIVYERHHDTGNFAVGIVGNYNIDGAIASTVSHDSHNIVCIGSNDADIALAITTVADINGGYVVTKGGAVTAQVSLPIAGILSDEDPDTLNAKVEKVIRTAHAQGVSAELDPLQPLSFLALSVLPEVRITDYGVVNVLESCKKLTY